MDKLLIVLITIYCAILPIDQFFSPIPEVTYGKLVGGIVLLFLLPYIFNKRIIPKGIIVSLWMLIVWMLMDTVIFHGDSLPDYYYTLVLNVLVAIGIVNFIFKDRGRIDIVLITLIVTTSILSLFIREGIGNQELGERISIEGLNANNIGMYASVSITAIVYFIMFYRQKKRWLLLAFLPLCFYSLANTGSRGGFISLMIGLSAIFIFRKTKLINKIGLMLVGAIVVGIAAMQLYSTDIMRERMEILAQQGDTSREYLWEAAWNMYQDNIVEGIGLGNFTGEMFQRTGHAKDSHNAYLFILATTGTIGGILLLITIISWMRLVYANGKQNNDTIGLSLLLMLLFDWGKTGSAFFSKFTWILFAITIAIALNSRIESLNNARKLK